MKDENWCKAFIEKWWDKVGKLIIIRMCKI